ncbi:MAG: fungal specific transcription factor domain-containing protein [Terriglobus roseus]|nr:fungal specific transcription factor domain-containing protein [Terriglobus roseus]
MRIEGLLQNNVITTQPVRAGFVAASSPAQSPSNEAAASPFPRPEMRTRRASSAGLIDMIPVTGLGTWSRETLNISTMPKRHTTPAFHLLQWPKIRDLISKPYDPQVLLQVEMAREPLDYRPTAPIDLTHAASYVQGYFESVNKWYACVNPFVWSSYYRTAHASHFRDGAESCIVLLVMALGEAAIAPSIAQCSPEREPPGYNFFAHAWTLLPSLMTHNNIHATQCYILASAYLFYVVRPLEAWTLLANASMKLQLLLSAPGRLPAHAKELCERVYWNALLFERSDSQFSMVPVHRILCLCC